MQANFQHTGQQNLHGNEDRSGDWTSHNTDQFQMFQATTGNYCSQFSHTALKTTSDQTVTSNPQSTNNIKPAQENHKHTSPAGQQNFTYCQWNMPVSGCQIFLPEGYMNSQDPIDAASNNNGTNMYNNSNNSVCVQPQTTSTPTLSNCSQRFKAKTVINSNSLNYTGRDLNSCLDAANNNLPDDPSHKNMTLPSDSKYLASKNAPHGHSSSFGGYMYHRLRTESSASHVNLRTLSTRKPNLTHISAAQKAVAIVTPLTPVETPAVNLSNTSAKQDQQSASGQTRDDGQASANMCHDQAATDQKTDAEETDSYSTIPVTEWSLNKLQALMSFIQKIEDARQKNVKKTDAGEEILKLYWNGDFDKLHNAFQNGTYRSLMEDVNSHRLNNDDVVLRQIKKDARKQVAKDFHILKHNEVPPRMLYKSSWMNLNEKLDDIDRECGYSWCYKSLYSNYSNQDRVQHENSAQKFQSRWLDASDVTSVTKHQHPAETVNKITEQQQTLLNNKNTNTESLRDEQLSPVTSDDNSSKLTDVVDEQTSCQPNTVNLLTTLVRRVDKQGVPAGKPNLTDRFHNFETRSFVSELSSKNGCTSSPQCNPVIAGKSQDQTGSSETITNSDCTVTGESITGHDQYMMNIVNKVPVEKTVLELNETSSSPSKDPPVSFNKQSHAEANCSSKYYNMAVTEQSSCQQNTVNPLQAITNLVKTLERGFSKRKKQCFTAATSKKPRQDERFHSKCKSRSPAITNESTGKQQEIVPSSQISEVRNSAHRTQNTVLGSQTGHQSPTETVNKVPVEEQMFSDLKERNSDNESHSFLGLTQTGDNSSPMPSGVVTEQTNCQPNPVNLPKSFTDLLTTLNKYDVSLRIYEHQVGKKEILKRMQNCSSKTSVDQQTPFESKENGPESLRTDENLPLIVINEDPPAAANKNSSLKHKLSLPEQNNCQPRTANPLKDMASLVGELDKHNVLLRKRQQQIGRETSKRKRQHSAEASRDGQFIDKNSFEMNDSASFKIHILPHEVAKLCFKGEKIEDYLKVERLQEDTARPPETKRRTREQKLLKNKIFEEAKSKYNSTEASGSPDKSSNQTDFTSPPKLNPVDAEQHEFLPSPQLQSKYSEKTSKCDCAVTDDSLTLPKPITTAALQVRTEELGEMDSSASIKTNVLSHEIAAHWFFGEKTEEIKPKERKNPAVVDVKLKSYCCLSKWLQTLKFADSSSCICQVKPELNKQDMKTRGIFSDYRCRELKMSTLEKIDEDVSECTEKTWISHTDPPNSAAEDKIEFVKDRSVSKEVLKQEGATPEQISGEFTTTHAQNVKKCTPSSDVRRTKATCLSLNASSSNSQDEEKQKRCENVCEEPREVTTISHQNSEEKKKQKRDFSLKHNSSDTRKELRASLKTNNQSRSLQFQDEALTKGSEVTKENVLSSTLSKNLFNPRHHLKSDENKQKRKTHLGMRRLSMNKCIIRRKTVSLNFLQSQSVMRSKYELGNPALMPLREAVGLEFKVLPESFNFNATELNRSPADTTSTQPEEDKTAERMKTSHSSIQGKWCFSPLKTKFIQSTEVSGSSTVFQQFQRKYQERKKTDSGQNLRCS